MAWPSLALHSGFGVRLIRILSSTHSQFILDFVVSKLTPRMITSLGYKIFFLFAVITGIGNTIFSLFVITFFIFSPSDHQEWFSLIPETKGKSLEEVDVIFEKKRVGREGATSGILFIQS